jgi:3-methyladenine DNA glycosylase AlkD
VRFGGDGLDELRTAGNPPCALVQAVARTSRCDDREERYAAIALLDTPAARRLRDPAVLRTLRELIATGAWWDYVDELAHRVGDLLLSWPAEVRPELLTWTRSDDRWLRRASIICQLGMRGRTDVELLTTAIESAIGDGDSFLRKAIGWALRDYARTDPAWVALL